MVYSLKNLEFNAFNGIEICCHIDEKKNIKNYEITKTFSIFLNEFFFLNYIREFFTLRKLAKILSYKETNFYHYK